MYKRYFSERSQYNNNNKMSTISQIRVLAEMLEQEKNKKTICDLVDISSRKSRVLSRGTPSKRRAKTTVPAKLRNIILQNCTASLINSMLMGVRSGKMTIAEFERQYQQQQPTPTLERQPATEPESDMWSCESEEMW